MKFSCKIFYALSLEVVSFLERPYIFTSMAFQGLLGDLSCTLAIVCWSYQLPTATSRTSSVNGWLFSATQGTAGRWTAFKLSPRTSFHGFVQHLLASLLWRYVMFSLSLTPVLLSCADVISTVYIYIYHLHLYCYHVLMSYSCISWVFARGLLSRVPL